MYKRTWISGSVKSGRWTAGIAEDEKAGVVVRGKTYTDVQSKVRRIIALLNAR